MFVILWHVVKLPSPFCLFLYISIDFILRVADLLASLSQNKRELLNGIKWGRVNGTWGCWKINKFSLSL